MQNRHGVGLGWWPEVDRSEPQNVRIVIKPENDAAEAAIERHTREMARHWLS